MRFDVERLGQESRIEALKWSALLFMLADHVGFILVPEHFVFRLIGRLAFPLFCLIIALRLVEKPERARRYLGRLALWAIASQPAFWFAFCDEGLSGFFSELNVMVTLGLGVLVSLCVDTFGEVCRRRRGVSVASGGGKLLLALGGMGCAVMIAPFVDYYLPGVLMIPLLVWVLRSFPSSLLWWLGGAAFLVNLYCQWDEIFGEYGFVILMPVAAILSAAYVWYVSHLQFGVLPRLPGWLFYAFYPVHLFLVSVVALVLNSLS